jgi:uncharacterized protein (TIGR00255 family)
MTRASPLASPLASMTGFGRAAGTVAHLTYVWELKSVNGKALDVRLRLPGGWDVLENEARHLIGKHVTRGNVSASLALSGSAPQTIKINEDVLAAYVIAANRLAAAHAVARPTAADLLNMRGVADVSTDVDEAVLAQIKLALTAGLEAAVHALAANRQAEGARLAPVLSASVDKIEAAVAAAAVEAALLPGQLAARLTARLAEVQAHIGQVDPDRLAQEVAMLALKADVTEELDRLSAHIAAARDLLAKPEPVGRAFDFLAQEFNRETNTLCAKAASVSLTRIGLELKMLIDQLREQIQNLE